eukprot:scaffold179021_cov29-Tisochrysis_lutea.AAC.1
MKLGALNAPLVGRECRLRGHTFAPFARHRYLPQDCMLTLERLLRRRMRRRVGRLAQRSDECFIGRWDELWFLGHPTRFLDGNLGRRHFWGAES